MHKNDNSKVKARSRTTTRLPQVQPDLDVDYGIITGGLCATPEAQEEFDRTQKGKPPKSNNGKTRITTRSS